MDCLKKVFIFLFIIFTGSKSYAISQKIIGDFLITSGNILPSGNLTTTQNYYNIGATNNYWVNSYVTTANTTEINMTRTGLNWQFSSYPSTNITYPNSLTIQNTSYSGGTPNIVMLNPLIVTSSVTASITLQGTKIYGDANKLILYNSTPGNVWSVEFAYLGLKVPNMYSQIIGGTNRDLYIDDTGLIGYISSLRKYKKNFRSLRPYSLKIYELQPYAYEYIKDNTTDFGLVADEVEQILPEICSYSKTGELETVNYSKLTPLLLNELILTKRRIDELEARIEALEAK